MLTISEATYRRRYRHRHQCVRCHQWFSAWWVWSGYPDLDDCACDEARMCDECEQAVEEQVDEQKS